MRFLGWAFIQLVSLQKMEIWTERHHAQKELHVTVKREVKGHFHVPWNTKVASKQPEARREE